MGQRFPVSGYNNDAIATNAYSLLNSQGAAKTGVTSGRSFWMKSITITNTHASGKALVDIFDQAEDASNPPTAANQRLTVIVGPEDTVMLDFPGPGIEFLTGCVAAQTGGTVAKYAVATSGYEV